MGLYILPAYGYVLKRKPTSEEVDYAEDNFVFEGNVIFRWSQDSNSIVFLYKNEKMQHIYEGDTFFIDNLFEYSDERKEQARDLFKEFLTVENLPDSLKDISAWEEGLVMHVISWLFLGCSNPKITLNIFDAKNILINQ